MGNVAAGAIGLGFIISVHDKASRVLDKIRTKLLGVKGVSEEMTKTFTKGMKKITMGLGVMASGAIILSKAGVSVFCILRVLKRKQLLWAQPLLLFRSNRPQEWHRRCAERHLQVIS